MRVRPIALLLALALLALAGCSREEFYVDSVQAVPYMERDTGQMGLVLYVATSIDEEKTPLRFDLSSPGGLFSWSLDASHATAGGVSCSGSSDIAMPSGSDLPKGLWALRITLPDGRVFDEEFSIDYEKPSPGCPLPEGPVEEGAESQAVFDKDRNICLVWRRR